MRAILGILLLQATVLGQGQSARSIDRLQNQIRYGQNKPENSMPILRQLVKIAVY